MKTKIKTNWLVLPALLIVFSLASFKAKAQASYPVDNNLSCDVAITVQYYTSCSSSPAATQSYVIPAHSSITLQILPQYVDLDIFVDSVDGFITLMAAPADLNCTNFHNSAFGVPHGPCNGAYQLQLDPSGGSIF